MPGLYPGRVCAIENPAVLVSGQYQAEQVQKMMRRGMMELTVMPQGKKCLSCVLREQQSRGIRCC